MLLLLFMQILNTFYMWVHFLHHRKMSVWLETVVPFCIWILRNAVHMLSLSYVLLVNRKLNCISVVENKWTKIFFLSSFFLFYLFFFFNSNHSPCTSTQTISLFRFYCVRILPEPIDCSFVCSFGLFHRSRYLAIPFVGWMSVSMSEREVCAYPNYISVRVVCILTNQSNFH